VATKNILNKFKKKITVIPNGIDTSIFYRKNVIKEENSILFVSILDKYHEFKGLPYLLKAVKALVSSVPNIQLFIIGEGELKVIYEKLASELGISEHVIFLGEISQSKLATYYSRSTVFVLPSTEIEGFGIVLLEAMACEIPVIATDIVGTSDEIKKYQTGIVINPKNVNSLKDALMKILTNKKLQAQMGKNGRMLIESKYSWNTIANQIQKVYLEN
jgi:glycosyltransferase involved in cell wall biosynthesis